MNKTILLMSIVIPLFGFTPLLSQPPTLLASKSHCLTDASNNISTSNIASPIPADVVQNLANSNQKFAFKLYQALVKQNPDENVFISPNSISLALTMVYNGANGKTKTEMAETLELIGMTPKAVNQANHSLQDSLEKADPKVTLAIANSLWVREGFPIKDSFCQTGDVYYDAKVEELDFADPKSLQTINQWVSINTQQKIKKIINKLNPTDVLILLNALYFKGEWQEQFDPNKTSEQTFHLADGRIKPHPLMWQQREYDYYENEKFQAVSLPYGNGRMSMYIFLPQANTDLASFHQELTSDSWTQWLKEFRNRKGIVELPRFKLESEFKLKKILISLGMQRIFDDDQADFSALTDEAVAVNQVTHKTFVEVNEEGTEAAAVTSVSIQTSLAIKPFHMKVDRPFFSALRDNETGTLLFLGAIMEPH